MDVRDVAAVEGFYEQFLSAQTIEEHDLKQASIVHVDCDLYESTTTVEERTTLEAEVSSQDPTMRLLTSPFAIVLCGFVPTEASSGKKGQLI